MKRYALLSQKPLSRGSVTLLNCNRSVCENDVRKPAYLWGKSAPFVGIGYEIDIVVGIGPVQQLWE